MTAAIRAPAYATLYKLPADFLYNICYFIIWK